MDIEEFMKKTENWLKGKNHFLDDWDRKFRKPLMKGIKPGAEIGREVKKLGGEAQEFAKEKAKEEAKKVLGLEEGEPIKLLGNWDDFHDFIENENHGISGGFVAKDELGRTWYIKNGRLAVSEAANERVCYQLLKEMDLLPTADIKLIKHEGKWWTASLDIREKLGEEMIVARDIANLYDHLDPVDEVLMDLFDSYINNSDRHLGNYLTYLENGKSRIALIDNSLVDLTMSRELIMYRNSSLVTNETNKKGMKMFLEGLKNLDDDEIRSMVDEIPLELWSQSYKDRVQNNLILGKYDCINELETLTR